LSVHSLREEVVIMARILGALSILALLPPAILAALVVARRTQLSDLISLESVALLVSYLGLLLFLVVVLLAVVNLLQRHSWSWAIGAIGLVLLGIFVALHAEWGWFLPDFGLESGLEHALLPAIVPVLTLIYSRYAVRHPAVPKPVGS
jgi:hypothetical protein